METSLKNHSERKQSPYLKLVGFFTKKTVRSKVKPLPRKL